MSKHIQAVRGMHDILPESISRWQYLERSAREVFESYGYGEIRTPMLEKTELFRRSIGEVTDIVEKEMYTFEDRNGESLTLRPEGTASCVRACMEHGLLHNQTQRLYYAGPMFRHERPQKGRYRQFYQLGVEAFGLYGPDVDAELILMTARLWRRLGLRNVHLEINSLGSLEARNAYRAELQDYLRGYFEELDEDSKRRLETNPLRVLDSKNPRVQQIVAGAPSLLDRLDQESREHFEQLRAFLDAAGVVYKVNPRLVRGLDYYGKTVFEWITEHLGAQGTVCAGGRFDGLVEQLGGKPAPAVGFAMGVERLVALLEDTGVPMPERAPHAYVIAVGDSALAYAMTLSEDLRESLPGLRMLMNCGGGGFKNQFKRADQSGAELALVIGDDEAASGRVGVKDLRGDAEQQTLSEAELMEFLRTKVND